MNNLGLKIVEKALEHAPTLAKLRPEIARDIQLQMLMISWLASEAISRPGMIVPLLQELRKTKKALLDIFRD